MYPVQPVSNLTGSNNFSFEWLPRSADRRVDILWTTVVEAAPALLAQIEPFLNSD